MGISIELYRSRIGTFGSYSMKQNKKLTNSCTSSASTTSFSKSIAKMFAVALFFTICIVDFKADSLHSRTIPPPCPTSPAYYPSSGPCTTLAGKPPTVLSPQSPIWLPPWPPPWHSAAAEEPFMNENSLLHSTSWLSAKQRNFIAKITNGNRRQT